MKRELVIKSLWNGLGSMLFGVGLLTMAVAFDPTWVTGLGWDVSVILVVWVKIAGLLGGAVLVLAGLRLIRK